MERKDQPVIALYRESQSVREAPGRNEEKKVAGGSLLDVREVVQLQ